MQTFKVLLKNATECKIFTKQELEKHFDFTYRPVLEYSNWKVETFLRKKSATAYVKNHIRPIAIWLGKLHAKKMEEAAIPDITIQWLGAKKGYGVITNEKIKKWGFVGEYTGLVRRRRIIFPDLNDYCFMYPREWLSLKPFTIDSEKEGNFTRFINHSDFPNLESVGVFYDGCMHIIFRAIKDIEIGTELSYDYGDVYWDKRIKLDEGKKLN